MKLQWTVPAVDDLECIRNYIARDSELYAAGFVDKVLAAVDTLEFFPELGRRVTETNAKNVRELLFQNYRVVYRIHAETIQILTIIHGSREIGLLPVKPWNIR
jgi:toxin ParE1/3/4